MFPEGEKEGLYHTADATLWFFHALVALPRRVTAIAITLDAALSEAAGDRRRACRRHPFRHSRRSARRPAVAGRGGLPADLDGREGRRLGRHAAARQGGRDQRALVQRAPADGAVGAESRDAPAAAEYRAARRSGVSLLQRALLVRATAVTCTTSSTPKAAATIQSAARTRCSRYRCRNAVLRPRSLGAGGSTSSAIGCSRRSVSARWRRATPTSSRATTATCARATRHITRERCGRWLVGPFVDAWLKVYPDDAAGARDALRGFVPHLDDACIGIDQRDLRRGCAVHAARLHRPGVECGGSPSRDEQD